MDQAADVRAANADALYIACKEGNLDVLRELLALTGDMEVDVNPAVTDAGFVAAFVPAHRSPIVAASEHGHLDLVRELLALTGQRTADVNIGEDEAFMMACCNGHLAVVRELLRLEGNRAVDVHARQEDAFRSACDCNHLPVVRELLALTGHRAVDVHALDETAFFEACSSGNLAIVRELLALEGDRTVNVHARDERAFRWACAGGFIDVVRELLELTGDRAVDVHAGDTPGFALACLNGYPDVVRELLALPDHRAVDVHANEEEAFLAACERRSVDVVRLLLDTPSFTWDTPRQQAALTPVLVAEMLCLDGTALLSALLCHAPLPPQWLAAVFQPVIGNPGCRVRPPADMQAAQAAMTQCWQLLQQVLLGAATGVGQGGNIGLPVLGRAYTPFVRALALCCVLPGGDMFRLRCVFMPCLLAEPVAGDEAEDDTANNLKDDLEEYYHSVAWHGVAVPLTPNAPGADIARAQLGALSRPGRRAIVLRRAARRVRLAAE